MMKSKYTKDEKKQLTAFGARMKLFREESGLSQEKLALKCGLDRTYIGSVERGERNISLINIHKIAEAMDILVHELMKEEYDDKCIR
jgi:transcriptional regulator with XRE-family HTH domain